MGTVQLNQIRDKVLATCGGLVDVSDVSPDQRDITRLTRGLAAWALTKIAGVTDADAAAAITDGFDDNGLDAVLVANDSGNPVVYLVQSKWKKDGKGSPAVGDVHKFVQGIQDIINVKFDRFNEKVRAKQAEIEGALSCAEVKFVLILAHPGTDSLSDNARRPIEDAMEEINDPLDTISFQMLTQRELHSFLTREVRGVKPDLDVTMYGWGSVTEPYTAFYGQVEAVDIAEWFTEHGSGLFAENLRLYLGHQSDVNTSIIETLATHPEQFWYLNNGITVLCESVARNAINSTSKKVGKFAFRGVSVVNGAQTVGCIGKAVRDHAEAVADARVLVRFISLEHCPEHFGSEVTRGTNTQNRVERRDFVALDPEQTRLVEELAIDNVRYAIRSGESVPESATGFTVIEATIAMACAQSTHDLAVQAKREIGRLWVGAEDQNPTSQYRQLFHGGLHGSDLWRAVQALRAVETALAEEQAKRDGRDRLIGAQGNRLIAYQVFQRLKPGWMTNPAVDIAATLAEVPDLVGPVYRATIEAVNTHFQSNYVASLFKNASRCGDVVRHVKDTIDI